MVSIVDYAIIRALRNHSTAGLPLESVSGTNTSVFTGCMTMDWQHLQLKDAEQCDTTTALGIQPCINANRVSWFFNLTGNSANIDTACSSSLVALDLGCSGLINKDNDMVSTCNLIIPLSN
jgi:acyl transferase domain-containing protein